MIDASELNESLVGKLVRASVSYDEHGWLFGFDPVKSYFLPGTTLTRRLEQGEVFLVLGVHVDAPNERPIDPILQVMTSSGECVAFRSRFAELVSAEEKP